jgi:hypothetical protein
MGFSDVRVRPLAILVTIPADVVREQFQDVEAPLLGISTSKAIYAHTMTNGRINARLRVVQRLRSVLRDNMIVSGICCYMKVCDRLNVRVAERRLLDWML